MTNKANKNNDRLKTIQIICATVVTLAGGVGVMLSMPYAIWLLIAGVIFFLN
ncbi:MAG TPA: hypothetical protein VK031_07265 [Tissierellaceae bacterium]|nr:hypothetical protein [Tissierellaceae bacterium]